MLSGQYLYRCQKQTVKTFAQDVECGHVWTAVVDQCYRPQGMSMRNIYALCDIMHDIPCSKYSQHPMYLLHSHTLVRLHDKLSSTRTVVIPNISKYFLCWPLQNILYSFEKRINSY